MTDGIWGRDSNDPIFTHDVRSTAKNLGRIAATAALWKGAWVAGAEGWRRMARAPVQELGPMELGAMEGAAEPFLAAAPLALL